MYYLTIEKDGSDIVRRKEFSDYYDAVHCCAQYYSAKSKRSVLSLTTEVINGEFARSYVELAIPESIDVGEQARRLRATKYSNAFEYDGSYFFLIETEVGIRDSGDGEMG